MSSRLLAAWWKGFRSLVLLGAVLLGAIPRFGVSRGNLWSEERAEKRSREHICDSKAQKNWITFVWTGITRLLKPTLGLSWSLSQWENTQRGITVGLDRRTCWSLLSQVFLGGSGEKTAPSGNIALSQICGFKHIHRCSTCTSTSCQTALWQRPK